MKFFWQRESHIGRRSASRSPLFGASSFSAWSMVLLMVAPAPGIASEQAKLTVSATVLKHASLQVLTQPTSVVITAADIARGYVDAAAPSRISIRSNSSLGYMLDFASRGDFMRRILVRGLDTEVQLSTAGGAVMQPSAKAGVTRSTLDLRFRFLLAETARPGTYAWPMRLSITAI